MVTEEEINELVIARLESLPENQKIKIELEFLRSLKEGILA